MSKLTWVCGASLALAFATAACSSDDDTTPVGNAGAHAGGSGGRAGATGVSGAAGKGGAAQGGGTSEAGTGNEPGEGGASGDAGAGGNAGSEAAGAGGVVGEGGEGGAPTVALNCLADGTVLSVTAAGTSAYAIGGLPAAWSDGAGDNNAPLTLCRGYSYTFAMNVAGHPFYFKTAAVTGAGSAFDTGVTNNGAVSGNIQFTVPALAPDTLYYQCAVHAAMHGTVNVVDIAEASRR